MLHLRENGKKTGIFASFLTIMIIGLLILAGPANAFGVSLGIFSNESPKQGDLISAEFNITMSSNEYINISSIVLNSDKGLVCSVSVNGGYCEGITIEKQSSSDAQFGYGYGYGYGFGYGYGYDSRSSKLVYLVTINTSVLEIGSNDLTLTVNTNGYNVSSNIRTVIVNAIPIVDTTTNIGSSGGGACTTQWTCSEWSECKDGSQTRTCSYSTNWCAPRDDKPLELRTCSGSSDEDEGSVLDSNAQKKGFFNTITGAVIGTNAGRWSLAIILFLILVGLAWWIISAKKKRVAISQKKARK